ncbi:hypothetical protein HMPREF3038_01040 [Akkermansia sp. KLE1797]|nr:hypothetical protein HMPREF3038_01040 [Akkermansia sp. KLE1797]KXU53403.1 hypothetical protein HMPREF3039_02404 [Akkermansia sp. KLE1798]KZA05058.1 hypothetical protein HMPREF1326_01277 [Akkermansia sp. KLE1605]
MRRGSGKDFFTDAGRPGIHASGFERPRRPERRGWPPFPWKSRTFARFLRNNQKAAVRKKAEDLRKRAAGTVFRRTERNTDARSAAKGSGARMQAAECFQKSPLLLRSAARPGTGGGQFRKLPGDFILLLAALP